MRIFLTLLLSQISFVHTFTIPLSRKETFRNQISNLYSSSSSSQSSFTTEEKEEDPQVLRFIDPKSKTPITLIGCMHYNPTSIQLASRITRNLAESDTLHSVVIESCPTRWKSSRDFFSSNSTSQEIKDLYVRMFNNEMLAASTVALGDFNIPVVLGDQPIEITFSRVRYYFRQTLMDMKNLEFGKISNDVNRAFQTIRNSFGMTQISNSLDSKNYLTLVDYLDLELLKGMPFSFVRYPLSIAIRNIPFILSLFLLYFTLNQAWVLFISSSFDTATLTNEWLHADVMLNEEESLLETLLVWSGTIGLALLEVVLFLRILILPILLERDEAIAESIITVANDACLRQNRGDSNQQKRKGIVAVLGMAHINGVRDLIVNEKISIN